MAAISSYQTVGVSGATIDLNHFLVEASQSFSEDIYRRTIDSSVWLRLIKQGAWPDEMGDSISVLTYERTLPTTAQTWDPIDSALANTSKFAIPSATQVKVAQTIRTYGIRHTAVESQPIVVNDFRMGFRFREQIKAVYDNLVENVAWIWVRRHRDEYRRLCATKVIAGFTGSGTTGPLWKVTTEDYPETVDPGVTKIGILTQGILNILYLDQVRDGVGTRPMGRENGRPLLTLVCSPETSDAIIRMNPSTRDDYRYSNQVSELLKPLGVERSHRGYYHACDTSAPRYNYVGGAPDFTTGGACQCVLAITDAGSKVARITFSVSTAPLDAIQVGQKFELTKNAQVLAGTVLSKQAATGVGYIDVQYESNAITVLTAQTCTWVTKNRAGSTATQCFCEVPFYVPDVATTPGDNTADAKRWVVNPEYLLATYEESFIMHPEVMECLIPKPITSAGSGTNFNPVNYRGDFKFLNIQHRTENPDGTWGFYRGVMASGSKPVRPQYGVAIMHARVDQIGVFHQAPVMAAPADVLVESMGDALGASADD